MTLAELVAAFAAAAPRDGGVPAFATGAFRRRSITYHDGTTDTATRVFWLQSRGLTFDLRLPAAPTSDDAWLARADHEGGLAHTRWDGSRMSWTDWTALQLHDKWPEPGELFRVGDCLIERAPSGAYVEDWRLLPSADGPWVGLELIDESDSEGVVRHRGGGLVVCGDHAGFVRGRPAPLPGAPARLDEHVRATRADPAALAAAFACEASYAVRSGDDYVIAASTDPGRVGEALELGGFGYDAAAGLVVQKTATSARRYRIDTLVPAHAFARGTQASPEAEAWLAREARTLLPARAG